MTVGGLVGGANILDLVFKTKNSRQHVGWVGDTGITHQRFIRERDNQLAQLRRQGQTINGRAYQNASNAAWNNLVERILKDQKIDELGLEVQLDEIYDFLLLTPPAAFQDNLSELDLYTDADGNFDLTTYQNAVRNGTIPETAHDLLALWENYLRTWLADRKLRNLYNNIATVSNFEVEQEYIKQNVNCTLEYLFVNTSSITDSMVTISEDELRAKYDEDLDTYKTEKKRVVQYVLWEVPANIKSDTLRNVEYADSLMQDALLFVDEADLTSFSEAITKFEKDENKTLDIHEGFSANSGFPFPWGTIRNAVRFTFDNEIGAISDPINTDNGIVVLHITGLKDEDYQTFDAVKSGIERSLMRDKKKDYAKFYLSDKLSENSDWKTLAENDELIEWVDGDTQTIGGSFKTIGKSSQLTGTLLAMNEGQISQVITTFNTACIIKMTSKDEMDLDDFSNNFDDFKTQLINTKKSRGYSNWIKAAKDNIEILDNRASYY